MDPRENGPAGSQEILYVTRGEIVEVFRVRLISGDAAALERYENGEFLEARVFSTASALDGNNVSAEAEPVDGRRMDRAIRGALTYLDGSVSVGERDLLSPTSAMTRNLRWFPGDIQMLGTSFHYVRELFPSAQFHVSQLFRRVFGDVAFLGLILFSSACWLRTRGHAGLATLAFALQLLSIVAIIGFDRFWEPIRYRWKRVRQVRAPNEGLRGAVKLVGIVMSQIVHGIAAVTINTLVGLTNLLIHPVKIVQSFQRVRRGKSLEWKASSVSTGQDMRGWPVSDFLEAYGGAAWVGLAMLFFLSWLVLLGAPLDLFGLNSVGLFLASFLTAWFYAWHAALPHSAESGAPHYELSRGEFWGLTLVGVAGLLISWTLFVVGLYPMPAFESSTGVVALFLTATCAFAALFPSYYSLKRRYAGAYIGRAGWRYAPSWILLGSGLTLVVALLGSHSLRDWTKRAFVADKTRFRMPTVERNVYLEVGAALKRARVADPEPLLSASGGQLTLGSTNRGPVLDVRELRGLPAPRSKRLVRRDRATSTVLFAPPVSQRLPSNIPRREFVLATAESSKRPQPAQAERLGAVLEARRRARAMVPRLLGVAESTEQGQFLARAAYPWISHEELEKLGSADANGARLPLLEMARVHRFEEVKALWDQIPSADIGNPSAKVRYARLLDGVDGAVSLGFEPDAAHVRDFVALQLEVSERWPREFPHVPLGAVREHVAGTPSNAFLVARYAIAHGLSFDQLARRLRLDYLDWAWDRAPVAPAVQRLFRDRVEIEEPDQLKLDWGDSVEANARFDGLQAEQLVATKILRATLGSEPASPEQLERVLRLVEGVLGGSKGTPQPGLATALAQSFEIQGVAPISARVANPESNRLRARLWAQTMSGRIGLVAARVGAQSPLPGTELDQASLAEVSKLRFPDDAGDTLERRALDWLVLIDASATFRELVEGQEHFQRELAARGFGNGGLSHAPTVSEEDQWRDLFAVWGNLPRQFANIPARADLVAEFICQTAYFSSADGKHARTLASFLHDFQDLFAEVNRLMPESPPALIQELTDAAWLKTRGRVSRSPDARRFFAWWNVVAQARTVRYNLERHSLNRALDARALAAAWSEIARSGLERWPHLPWRVPGFSEYFLNLQQVEGLSLAALWGKFERQLKHADALSLQHVVPAGGFEALVERRISEKTGAPNFDPQTRRANALLALAELSDAAAANGVHFEDARATRLSGLLARMYETVSRDYPNLYWEGEGTLESYTLLGLVNGWDPQRTLQEFEPEWSLANALAAGGLLQRFTDIAEKEPNELAGGDRSMRAFIDTQALRLQKKTGLHLPSARSTGMNALLALSNLVLSAGEEGLLPAQTGQEWSKQRVRSWASRLRSSAMDSETRVRAAALAADFGELIGSMRAEGPQFPWEDGAFVETELLAARSSGVGIEAIHAARRETWRIASELASRHFAVPLAFMQLIERDYRAELTQKLAAVRGVAPAQVTIAEVRRLEDPENLPQTSQLALADVLAQIQVAYGTVADPASVAVGVAGMRAEGPRRYPNVPWAAKGFSSSLLVAAERPDFAGDIWRYVQFIDLPAVDRLLGEAVASSSQLPSEVLDDMRAIMIQQTGRTPSSPQVVAFQALRDGLFLVKEFLPELPPSLAAATTLVRVRARVRALADRFPALHIVTGDDQSLRIGFADRLAAIAARLTLRSGVKIDDPSFADAATELLEVKFLRDLSQIYALVRQSFPEEELAYYKQAIQRDALSDNLRKAEQSGLSANALSVPQVNDDDVVADFALYELLYAREIGQGPGYVVDLFEIYDKLQRRADIRADYRRGLAALDREAEALRAMSADEASWRSSPEFGAWWEKRGDFVKSARGNLLALSRTFALLKEAAFSSHAAPEARAAFARFGDFDQYLGHFFDNLAVIRHTPGFEHALSELAKRDAFLADGVQFAVAQFKLHVLDSSFGSPDQSADVIRQVAEFLPKVNSDYRAALGFSPGLESGVPFYDAFSSYVRADVLAPGGTDVLRRLNVVQRGLQRWTQSYFLKQAYKILFDRDLDEEDPTPQADKSGFGRLGTHTVGKSVHEFLESKLPQRLARETGGYDLVRWIQWLKDNGELDLEAQSLGKNPYADTVASYERRLTDYRARIQRGEASGKNVRAERQRVLDIEREYGSLQRQVELIQTHARQQAGFYARASRDFHESIWQSACWLLAIFASAGLARLAANRLAPSSSSVRRWLSIAAVGATLALGALPLWVATHSARAEQLAARPLRALRLLDSDSGALRTRGAAAQLERTQPWRILSSATSGEVDSR